MAGISFIRATAIPQTSGSTAASLRPNSLEPSAENGRSKRVNKRVFLRLSGVKSEVLMLSLTDKTAPEYCLRFWPLLKRNLLDFRNSQASYSPTNLVQGCRLSGFTAPKNHGDVQQ